MELVARTRHTHTLFSAGNVAVGPAKCLPSFLTLPAYRYNTRVTHRGVEVQKMKEQKSRTNVNFNSLPTCSVHLYSGGLFQCNSTALLTDLNHRERTRTKGCFETRLERLLLRLFSSVLDHHTFIPGGFVSRFCSLASAVVSGWLHCGRLDWNAVYTHIHEAQRDKLTTGTGNNTLNLYQCQTCQQSRLGSNIVFCSIVLPTRLY